MVASASFGGYVLVGIVFGIFFPFTILGFIRLWRIRHLTVIRKRHVNIVFISLGVMLVCQALGYMCFVAYLLSGYNRIFSILNIIFYPFTVHALPWTILWRCYLTFYDCQFAQAILNSKWHSIITNSNLKSCSNIHWSVKYHSTLGNPYFSSKIILSCSAVIITFSYIMWAFHYQEIIVTSGMGLLGDLILLMIAYIGVAYFYLRTPDLYDILLVKKEIKVIFILFFGQLVFYGFYAVQEWSVKTTDKVEIDWTLILLVLFCGIIPQFCIVFVSSHWIPNCEVVKQANEIYLMHNDSDNNNNNNHNNNNGDDDDDDNKGPPTSTNPKSPKSPKSPKMKRPKFAAAPSNSFFSSLGGVTGSNGSIGNGSVNTIPPSASVEDTLSILIEKQVCVNLKKSKSDSKQPSAASSPRLKLMHLGVTAKNSLKNVTKHSNVNTPPKLELVDSNSASVPTRLPNANNNNYSNSNSNSNNNTNNGAENKDKHTKRISVSTTAQSSTIDSSNNNNGKRIHVIAPSETYTQVFIHTQELTEKQDSRVSLSGHGLNNITTQRHPPLQLQESLKFDDYATNHNHYHNHNHNPTAVNLFNVVRFIDTFNLFTVHLINEFSIEILASIVEFGQFLRLIKDFFNLYPPPLPPPSAASVVNVGRISGVDSDVEDNNNIDSGISQAQRKFLQKFLANGSDQVLEFPNDRSVVPYSSIIIETVKNYVDNSAHSKVEEYARSVAHGGLYRPSTPKRDRIHMHMDKNESNLLDIVSKHVKDSLIRSTSLRKAKLNGGTNLESILNKSNKHSSNLNDIYYELIHDIALQLVCKYIQVGSDLEINISFYLRKSFARCLNSINNNGNVKLNYNKIVTLAELFDSANRNMIKFLSFSFDRFRKLPNVDALTHSVFKD